jgi:predicted DNA-binding protein
MKKKTVTITMSAELKARIDAAARRESRSLASFVRRACELYAQDVEAKRTDPPARGEQ